VRAAPVATCGLRPRACALAFLCVALCVKGAHWCRFGTDTAALLSPEDLQVVLELQIPRMQAAVAKKLQLAAACSTKKDRQAAADAVRKLPEPSAADLAAFRAAAEATGAPVEARASAALLGHQYALLWLPFGQLCGDADVALQDAQVWQTIGASQTTLRARRAYSQVRASSRVPAVESMRGCVTAVSNPLRANAACCVCALLLHMLGLHMPGATLHHLACMRWGRHSLCLLCVTRACHLAELCKLWLLCGRHGLHACRPWLLCGRRGSHAMVALCWPLHVQFPQHKPSMRRRTRLRPLLTKTHLVRPLQWSASLLCMHAVKPQCGAYTSRWSRQAHLCR
jgi:hypothetical protein